MFVFKQVGFPRFRVQYSKLNADTIPDSYPLSRIHEFMSSLRDVTLFSTPEESSGL